jgi:hypothetical protein
MIERAGAARNVRWDATRPLIPWFISTRPAPLPTSDGARRAS